MLVDLVMYKPNQCEYDLSVVFGENVFAVIICVFVDQGRSEGEQHWRLSSEGVWWGYRGQTDQWENKSKCKLQ